MNTSRTILFSTLALLLILPFIMGVSFSLGPLFTNPLAVTDEDLTCSWTYSGDTLTQNITVYKDGVYFDGRNESGGSLNTSFTVSSSNTAKNQDWECFVRLNNATDSVIDSGTMQVQNAGPETPIIYNSSNDNIGQTYNVTEDTTYLFDINSSDKDGDIITYRFIDAEGKFCTVLDNETGSVSCTPTTAYHTEVPTNVDVIFTVSDDDALEKKYSTQTVTFTVIPNNDAPNATLTTQTTPVNTTLNYTFDATDEENDFPLTFALVNPPIDQISIAALDDDTARITYDATSPDYFDVNTSGWPITVNITDTNNASTLVQFLLNITAVGRPPQITNFSSLVPLVAGNYVLNQGENIIINVTANDSDTDDVHTYFDNSVRTYFETTQLEQNVNVTGNSSGQVNFTATNDDIGQFSTTITVRDSESLINTIELNFTVNNINDVPTISEISTDTNNTNGNTNLTNVSSYVDLLFTFAVNATDPDLVYGDNLTYTSNSSLFTINPTTGIINFTPSNGDIQAEPYVINVTVTDNASVQASRIMNLYVLDNTVPYFTSTPPNKSCSEGQECTYNLSTYAADADDYIESYTAVTSLDNFYMNSTTGFANFTANQSDIGNHTIAFTITDSRGAINTSTITLQINNTEDTPVLTRYNFSIETIVEDHLFIYQLAAEDNDLFAAVGENLTFSTNLTFGTISTYSTANNETTALFSFTPNSTQAGRNHTVNISVLDNASLIDSQIYTFEILNDSESPVIERIQPYGNVSNSSSPVESYNVTAQGTQATLAFTENTSYTFAHITTDDLTDDDPITGDLTTTWYYDDVAVASSWNYTRVFNFSSSGVHTLRLEVNDTMLESTNFTWLLSIANLNRAPQLLTPLVNFTNITTTYLYPDYLGRHNGTTYYIDPDDDINENNQIDGSETNNLVHTVTDCLSDTTTVATITIEGDDIVIVPVNLGSCTVIFTATDTSSETLQSNAVFINVTEQPEGVQETITQSSSGGGGSSRRSSFIPLTKEVKKPEALNILAPRLVTVYQNDTVIIPFEVTNTWTGNLEYIQLGVIANETDVQTSLSSNIIESLEINETVEIQLEVENYRLGNNYEVEITANVSSPDFQDSAVVLLTSIEQSSDGDDVEVKVTFARDLFNEHPECQELNELLDKAGEELRNSNFVEAERYVDTAINGCRHLVSTLQQNTEKPNSIPGIINLSEATLTTIIFTALAFLILSTIAFIIYYHYTSREEDDI